MNDNRRLSPDERDELIAVLESAGYRVRRQRPKRERTTNDLLGMVERTAAGMVKRADDGDVTALIALREMRDAINDAIPQAAQVLHYHPTAGLSWGDIGRELGMSRQAARQAFQRKPAASSPPVDNDQLSLDDV